MIILDLIIKNEASSTKINNCQDLRNMNSTGTYTIVQTIDCSGINITSIQFRAPQERFLETTMPSRVYSSTLPLVKLVSLLFEWSNHPRSSPPKHYRQLYWCYLCGISLLAQPDKQKNPTRQG